MPNVKIMNSLFRNPTFFVVSYLTLLIPTYLLPMLGSNSTVLNAIALGTGHGLLPQWWVHAWCLVMLILLAWLRGDFIGRKYLPIFPVLAAVFDLTPVLNMIPLMPTVFHVVTIILAVQVVTQLQGELADEAIYPTRKAAVFAGLMTVTAILGSAFFVISSTKNLFDFAKHKNDVPTKSASKESKPAIAAPTPEPVAAPTAAEPVVAAKNSEAPASTAASSAHHKPVQHQHAPQSAMTNGQSRAKTNGKVQYININE